MFTRRRKRRLEEEETETEALSLLELKLQYLQREDGSSGRVLSQIEHTL